jgi:hypothetical protein
MTTIDVELLEGEQLITEADELVYRQVTHYMLYGDKLKTEVFARGTAGREMPSYARSS